jgi:Tfp pilus assembly PilM family ATPase
MARIIGIDLGSWTVKLTVLEGGFSRFETDSQHSKIVPQADGNLPDLETRMGTLQDLLTEIDADENCLYGAGFPVDSASIRLVHMPFTDKNQIAQTLEFEVESLVPYDLDDMTLSHRIVSSSPEGSGVLAAMAPKNQVQPYIYALSNAGADPKSLIIDGDALGAYGDGGTEAIIDIGHARTVLTVTNGGQAVFSRGISLAGWHLTQALMRQAPGISFEEAEDRKHGARLSTTTLAQWEDEEATEAESSPSTIAASDQEGDTLRAALAPLLASLRTTLVSFEDTSGLEIDRIKLTGGTSQLHGIERLMKAEMGVPVVKLRTGSIDLHAPLGHALSAAFADRAAGIDDAHALELRQGEFKFRGNMANLRMIVLASAAVLLLGIISGIGMFAYKHQVARSRIAALDQQLAEAVALASGEDPATMRFDSADDALLALQLRTLEASERIDLLGAVVNGTPPLVSTLSQLSTALPDPTSAPIDVAELTVTSSAINMKATTDGYDAAANIETALAENERFKRARKGDEKKTSLGISFTVTIPLGEEDGEEG